MKFAAVLALLLSSVSAQASVHKITCSLQWKNTKAAPMSFYIVVRDLGTAKPVLLSKNPVDLWKQYVFGIKPVSKTDHLANAQFYQMAMGDPKTGSPGSDYRTGLTPKGDLVLNLDDGVSSDIDIVIYKSSGFRRGFIKNYCDESYCGDFNYYSELQCSVAGADRI